MSAHSYPCLCSARLARSVSFAASLLAMVSLLYAAAPKLQAQTAVASPTWRYDLTHTGQNIHETELTPANVNASGFGKLFSVAVDGLVYAQPLYIPGLSIGGVTHNVLFVATEHDSVYAFDADSNGGANAKPLWQVSLLSTARGAGAGATTVPWQDTASPDVAPEIGITGTPVINPATNTLYVVAATKENGVYFSRLHAINILTGAEAHVPVVVTATVTGTGTGSTGGKLTFSPLWQNQRGALNYYNGFVNITYAAHGDNGPWHGWVFSYNAATLAQAAAVCLTPNGSGAGVWSSGAGMPIDSDAAGGRMFVTTGNGTYNGSNEWGESILDFNLANGGLKLTDSFTTFNQQHLNGGDLDLGSGGPLMVPDQQGSHPHELLQVGKEGRMILVNRDHLGGYASGAASDTNAVEEVAGAIKGLWSTPAYWNGHVYVWGNGDVAKFFDLNTGVMNQAPASQATIPSAFPGASFTISANGAQNGIAWAVRTDQFATHGTEFLYAWNANDLSDLLYASSTNAARDSAGVANRFSIPVVTNGKVYVAGSHVVDVYGLFHGQAVAATPAITPNGGTFAAAQTVKLTSATASAHIYYTLDGTTPTTASAEYDDPITIGSDTTLSAIASAPGFVQSAISTAAFTFTNQTPTVTFSPAAGSYATTQQVKLADAKAGAKIYYTTNGATPTTASPLYTGPITVSASSTIKAIAVVAGLQNSSVASAAYVITASGSSINFGSGFSSTAGLTLNGSTVATNDTRLQLTNGLLNEAGSLFWSQPIGVQSFTTNFEFQLSSARAEGFTFTIQNVGPKALGSAYTGLGFANIPKSVAVKFDFYSNAGEGTDSTGVFTNGALPTVPAVNIAPSGIQLNSGDSIQATITYNGTTLALTLHDLVNGKTFSYSKAINIPQIVGGTKAYVGFTGSTGGLSASQKLLTWTYTAQ